MIGMAGAGLFEKPVEIIGNLDHRGIRVVGHGETDHQTRHLAVARDQAAGYVGGVQCDRFGPRQIGIVERLCVLDQRPDDEFVFAPFAVGIVGERVDPGRMRRAPRCFGQFLNGPQRLAGKYAALSGRNGNQGRIGCAVGVLECVECNQLRVVVVEQAAEIVGDADEAGACRHGQHEQRGENKDQPSKSQEDGGVSIQRLRDHRFGFRQWAAAAEFTGSGVRYDRCEWRPATPRRMAGSLARCNSTDDVVPRRKHRLPRTRHRVFYMIGHLVAQSMLVINRDLEKLHKIVRSDQLSAL